MTRMHPLHNATDIAKSIHATGEYFDQTRGTGRSTALALKFIAQAIEAPYKVIRIEDHADSSKMRSVHRNITLAIKIRGMLDRLGMLHFTVNIREASIMFGEASPTVLPTFAAPMPTNAHTARRMTSTESPEAMRRDAQYAYEKTYGRRL